QPRRRPAVQRTARGPPRRRPLPDTPARRRRRPGCSRLGGGLLRGWLLRRRLPRGGLLLRGGRAVTALGQQLRRPLDGDVLHRVALAERGVGLAIGDVRPEPAFLDHHRLLRVRVLAQLTQRRRGRRTAPPALLGLREQLLGLLDRDCQQLLLGPERPRVGALLQVRAELAVVGHHLLPVELAHHARDGQQLERVLQRDR